MEYSVRGRKFIGIVTKAKAPKTATVEWSRYVRDSKYERYEKKISKVKAHNELNAKEGDLVLVGETRKISKTKSFVILKILGQIKDLKEKDIEEIKKEEGVE